MGTPLFAVPTLHRLCAQQFDIVAVVTQQDKPAGRKRVLTPPPVKVAALELGLKVYQPRNVNKRDMRQTLASLKPDIAVVLAFGQILKPKLLDLFRHGCINAHGSILPAYRGAAPIQRAILAGETETGVTIMLMDEGLDTGPILLVRRMPIQPDETSGEVFSRMAQLGADAIIDALRLIERGEAVFTPQLDDSATYAAKLTESEGCIDWTKPAKMIHNMVRGMNPEPGASTCLDCLRIKIWKTQVIDMYGTASDIIYEPGTIVDVDKSVITVQTGHGLLRLLEVQPSGGKRMCAADFARGKRLTSCSCVLSEPAMSEKV